MISASTRKLAALTIASVIFIGIVSGSHYYEHDDSFGDNSFSVAEDSTFSIPQYDSQSELATQLVAPFIFIVVLLKFSFERVLQFVLDTNDHPPWGDDGADVSRESTIMAITVAGMMIPTPFWDYVRLVASGIGFAATAAVFLVVLFLIFAFLKA